jgi:hypothetical protein
VILHSVNSTGSGLGIHRVGSRPGGCRYFVGEDELSKVAAARGRLVVLLCD